MLYEIKA